MEKEKTNFYDYIIIGQGLAGTILAYTFLTNGKSVFIFNDESQNAAYKASAGLFNPITGKRMTKTWNAEKLFPFLLTFYKGLEKFLNIDFLHEAPIYKPFSSVIEQNEWLSKAYEQSYTPFINTSINKSKYEDFVESEYGGFETLFSGYINVPELVHRFREYLTTKKIYSNLPVNINSDFSAEDGGIQVHSMKAKKVIFCDGISGKDNSFFSWLPFTPVKGEILELTLEKEIGDTIFNKAGFIVPFSKSKVKAGSTYQRVFEDDNPSEKGKEEISRKINSFFKIPYSITSHVAGIRPAISDRRPVVGLHPENETIGIFNGLGTKGVSLAPFFAEQFFHYHEHGKQLDPEVNISRFLSLYRGE